VINVRELLETDPKAIPSPLSNVVPFYSVTDTNDKTLIFESRFESGNLGMAFKLSDAEYNLVLQNDVNTKGHT
jgi:hypothetical protein